MTPAVADFLTGIEGLLRFLSNAEDTQTLLGRLLEEKGGLPPDARRLVESAAASATSTKQYTYAVAVVSVYGLLERLVESLIRGLIEQFASRAATFEALPEAVRERHFRLSLDLLNGLERERYRADVSPEQIVANLNSCFSTTQHFRLNSAAFALHRGNVSLGRITELLSGIGIANHLQRAVRAPALEAYLREMGPERLRQSYGDAELRGIFATIDDVVRRRNDVAHGVIQADEIQAISILKNTADFAKAYGLALAQVLHQEWLRYLMTTDAVRPLGKPIATYNNCVVCFEWVGRIAVGEDLFAITGDANEPVRFSAVESLQIEREAHQVICTDVPVRFGAKVGFRVKETFDYYLVPSIPVSTSADAGGAPAGADEMEYPANGVGRTDRVADVR